MPDVATKDDIAEAMKAFDEFKGAVDAKLAEIKTKGSADPLLEEKITRLNGALDKAEDFNQQITQATLLAKKAAGDAEGLAEKLDGLEVKMNRPGAGKDLSKAERRAEIKARGDAWARGVHAAVTLGRHNISETQAKAIEEAAAEYKALNITDDTAGGFLAPIDFVQEILKTVVLISPVRALARIRQTGAKSVVIPKRTGLMAATWAGELDTRNADVGLKYGSLEIFNFELYAIVDISNQMLEDAAFDMGGEIMLEASEQFAVSEGLAFVSGSGVGRPEGFLTNKDTIAAGNVSKTGDANLLSSDGVLGCYHDIKGAYARNGVWTMNRQTVGKVRQLKDGEGDYLFMMGLPNGAPNTVIGAPYVEVPDMPNVAAGTYPIAFGDFARGYTLVDRVDMYMLRDPFTQATSGNVRYLFRKRLGGQVVMPEAIRPLLVSA